MRKKKTKREPVVDDVERQAEGAAISEEEPKAAKPPKAPANVRKRAKHALLSRSSKHAIRAKCKKAKGKPNG